jgi:uncharacterized membrane protein YphA (DoxX/SURF4 family)
MSISSRIARPLLASMFISGGMDAIQAPEGKVKSAAAVTEPLKARFAFLPEDPATLVRFNGMVQVGAGGLLALGKFRRLASWALVASVIPTTYAGHRFWDEVDDEARTQQRVHFLKNLGLLGGLILSATDTEGAPSLGWRARRRAGQVTTAIGAGRAATTAAGKGRRAGRMTTKAARRSGHQANQAVSDGAKSGVTFATPYVRHANETAAAAARAAFDGAAPYVSAGLERAGEVIAKASEHLPG